MQSNQFCQAADTTTLFFVSPKPQPTWENNRQTLERERERLFVKPNTKPNNF